MARSQRLAPIASLLALVVAASLHCSKAESGDAPDRIILIVVDTLRRDHVSAYTTTAPSASSIDGASPTSGAVRVPVQTPNIDRLAAEGQLFRNAVSGFHATTMSMAALFAGRTPSIESGEGMRVLEWNSFFACGMSRFSESGEDDHCVPQAVDTLAEDLREAGYWTLGVVSNELLYRPAGYDQGFDKWVEVGLPAPGEKLNLFQAARLRAASDVNREVMDALASRPSSRFFLYVHYIDVHDFGLFQRSYGEAVRVFDRHLGELLDELEAGGLLENATLLLTSDHGEMLVDEHLGLETKQHFGNPSFEPVLGIPLIVTPPIEGDAQALIRSQDVRGLIRNIAGLEGGPTPDLEGDEHFVSEMRYQTYRKGRWKSIWPRSGAKPMLFDLVADPHETKDLSTEGAEVLAVHRERIDGLSRALASRPPQRTEPSEEELSRLRALGYLETTKDEFRNPKTKSE